MFVLGLKGFKKLLVLRLYYGIEVPINNTPHKQLTIWVDMLQINH